MRRFGHIAVSGTTARDVGRSRAADDCYAQTRSALETAISALEALGGRVEDVVRTRVYLAPGAGWEEASRAHAELLGAVAPANTMLHVAGLIGSSYLVEVELDAVVAREDGS